MLRTSYTKSPTQCGVLASIASMERGRELPFLPLGLESSYIHLSQRSALRLGNSISRRDLQDWTRIWALLVDTERGWGGDVRVRRVSLLATKLSFSKLPRQAFPTLASNMTTSGCTQFQKPR